MRKSTPPHYALQAAVDDYLNWHALQGSAKTHRSDLRQRLAGLVAQMDRKTFIGARGAAFTTLLADSGLQVSEALHVRMKDIDLRRRSISVVGKGDRPRTVCYGKAVAKLLQHYQRLRAEAGPDELLFVSSLDEPLFASSLDESLLRFSMTRRIRAYGRASGIPGKRVRAHTLWHTFAVSWLMGGGGAFSLQAIVGHRSPEMTNRYVNLTNDDLAKRHREVSPLDHLQRSTPEAQSLFRERWKRRRQAGEEAAPIPLIQPAGSMPNAAASTSRTPCGHRVVSWTVSASPSQTATVANRPIGLFVFPAVV